MKKSLKLELMKVYVVKESDGYTSEPIGYFEDPIVAQAQSKFNGHRKVESIDLYSDGERLYQVSDLGVPKDRQENFDREMKAAIASKLSKEELDYILKRMK